MLRRIARWQHAYAHWQHAYAHWQHAYAYLQHAYTHWQHSQELGSSHATQLYQAPPELHECRL